MNNVPTEYYSATDVSGKRVDFDERPELQYGVYDIKAPSKFIQKPITENYIVICIESTKYMIDNGIFS